VPRWATRRRCCACHPASGIWRGSRRGPARGLGAAGCRYVPVAGVVYEAAMRAVGGPICAAVDAVFSGEAKTAFVAGRPPGHHAERETAMGFCLFGTVAIGAKRALDHHGLSRVAVWISTCITATARRTCCGTRGGVCSSPRTRCRLSRHRAPGEKGAHGQILNLPLPPGSDGQHMRPMNGWSSRRLAACAAGTLLIISAGFDAHARRPAGRAELDRGGFRLAHPCDLRSGDDCCGGRVVSALEGGYDLDALAASVAAHVGYFWSGANERDCSDDL
jgi:acetoin utilization deacetylase AcuC-like enzyme